MKRRNFLAGIAGTWALGPSAYADQQTKIPVVGFLGITARGAFEPFLAAFHKGLAEVGYVEGQNVAIEYRWAEGHEGRLADLAADLVSRNVDVIATSGGVLVARVAQQATSTIPIVFEVGVDPVSAGLVASMARPGGNLTGISILTAELNPKRFELLGELVPRARVIAVFVNPKNPSADRVIAELRKAAHARDVQIEVIKVGTEDDYATAFTQARAKAGALLVGNDPVFFSHREELVALAARYTIPAMYEWREFAAIGGLASYGTSVANMYREKGGYVGRLLAGAKPTDLPVQQPTKFELVINMKTAKALGLSIPQSLLARADEMIE